MAAIKPAKKMARIIIFEQLMVLIGFAFWYSNIFGYLDMLVIIWSHAQFILCSKMSLHPDRTWGCNSTNKWVTQPQLQRMYPNLWMLLPYLVAHPTNRKWEISQFSSGLTLLIPLKKTGVITHLLTEMSQEVEKHPLVN